MRIVIDLQSNQTASRMRGIGSYSLSLVKAMVRNRGKHDIILALSSLFPQTIEPIFAAFNDILPRDHIRVYQVPSHQNERNSGLRRESAELIREAFLESLQPDIVLITSLFEGAMDDAITSINSFSKNIPTSVIFYDLIPLTYPEHYLKDLAIKKWYQTKVSYLKKADVLLSISESSKMEAVSSIDIPPNKIINISAAADPQFKRLSVKLADQHDLETRFGISKAFVMYTGAADFRKNIKGLIRAYANLPTSLRETHQLVIVCSIQTADQITLMTLAKKHDLQPNEIIFTGFVEEKTLILLYNLCKVFVFPSFHEGFGLPVLEAMHCGRAVIAANTTSIPEIIDLDEALFDSNNDDAITQKLKHVLTDDDFRHRLEQHGLERAKYFSWDKSAKTTITALERCRTQYKLTNEQAVKKFRPKLAYLSPLPPERSEISDYSADLLPELAKYYDIELIVKQKTINHVQINHDFKIRSVDWFKKNNQQFDRVLYHFGNSIFHKHMFELLEQIPGVVVLHDSFLSNHLLNQSHWQQAYGLITHSEYSLKLAMQWYGDTILNNCSTISLPKVSAKEINKNTTRIALDNRIKKVIINQHDPAICAKRYVENIETFYAGSNTALHTLINTITEKMKHKANKAVLFEISNSLARNFPAHIQPKQLFIDISTLVIKDLKTGIQRVVRSLLKELIDNPPKNFRVVPVYAKTYYSGYFYAHKFVSRFLEYPKSILKDKPIDFYKGDIFLGADLCPLNIPNQEIYLQNLHRSGVSIYFIVYDLLPVLYPESFDQRAEKTFSNWLKTITQFDGALCISNAIAKNFERWTVENNIPQPFKIKWFHLGADLENSMPSRGMPSNANIVLNKLKSAPSFLVVGTMEPRKMHVQVLEAFEKLWDKGMNVNLVFIGRKGWMIKSLTKKLSRHPKLNKQFFCLSSASDEYLDKIYMACSCLIAASKAEGFGLPLIEAARHKLPIIARDIPIYREVAGAHAFYFNGFSSNDLALAIQEWLLLLESKSHPLSDNIPWLTWKQSTEQLLDAVFST